MNPEYQKELNNLISDLPDFMREESLVNHLFENFKLSKNFYLGSIDKILDNLSPKDFLVVDYASSFSIIISSIFSLFPSELEKIDGTHSIVIFLESMLRIFVLKHIIEYGNVSNFPLFVSNFTKLPVVVSNTDSHSKRR